MQKNRIEHDPVGSLFCSRFLMANIRNVCRPFNACSTFILFPVSNPRVLSNLPLLRFSYDCSRETISVHEATFLSATNTDVVTVALADALAEIYPVGWYDANSPSPGIPWNLEVSGKKSRIENG